MEKFTENIALEINDLPDIEICGKVTAIQGLLIECSGLQNVLSLGSRCKIITRGGKEVLVEAVGFHGSTVALMPFGALEGIGVGCKVIVDKAESVVYPCDAWIGRVLNAFAEPADDKGPLMRGDVAYHMKAPPPPAHKRHGVEDKIDLGIRSLNTFLTCCKGQRMGIFAGSGVGKSMLISMLTRFCKADVKVIGLIGERGREVHDFIHKYLGAEGLQNAIIVVATSDEPALVRKQAAYLTITIAEYFRDRGMDVLCLMDSITRFAMAQREIGLSAGEPPTSKGYTPTVFVELPKLLERAGPGVGKGSITGLFSVLVEGDDMNEPISDAVRGILDGHITLDRNIAERGRFPAVSVLKSVSRTLPDCNSKEENQLVNTARKLMAIYGDMEEMIRLGAYRKGSDPDIDNAIFYHDALDAFLNQGTDELSDLATGYQQLKEILQRNPKDESAKKQNHGNRT